MPAGAQIGPAMYRLVDEILDDDPKLAKAYDVTARRVRRLVKRWRQAGVSDVEIGVFIGSEFDTLGNVGQVFALRLAQEIGAQQ